MLTQMTERLHRAATFEKALQVILDDSVALLGAEYGNLQLPIEDALVIVAARGLSAEFLKAFWRVRKDDGCACGRALRLGTSVVIADVDMDSDFAQFLREAKDAGFRSVQSTPLCTSQGKLLGVVSTHFANRHEPTPIEMETLKQYSVIAADYAYELLDGAPLAIKARQLNDALYSNVSERARS